MSKRRKEADELITEPYLTKTEISRLLDIPWTTADTIYQLAEDIDERETVRYQSKKVRLETVLKITGLSFEMLEQQIKMRKARESDPQTIGGI